MKKAMVLLMMVIMASCHVTNVSIYGEYRVKEKHYSKYSNDLYKYKLRAVEDHERKFWEPGKYIWWTTDTPMEVGEYVMLQPN